MKNYQKYARSYFAPPHSAPAWVQKDYLDHPPIWCSVDLRDGNQALMVPMDLEEKLGFFQMLVKLGFKEIEVGFPAASETAYACVRTLIEKQLIPPDVTIQVLTQAREHIIRRTVQSLDGCPNAILHLYNSTSPAQRQQVFARSQGEILDIAVTGARCCLEEGRSLGGNCHMEYSPESFTATEPEFAAQVCSAVLDVWQPTPQAPAIINLPSTVSVSMPHIYASQVEYMDRVLPYRDSVILSLHPHNDRGCAVAEAELGMLAGAQRVEGTLFGNGERTGNLDLVTMALNLYSHGVDPQLSFEDLPSVVEQYEAATGLHVPDRQPYGGSLVFAAFSGSHQDASAKGLHWRKEHASEPWSVPYLPIDPMDIGRRYADDVIRINSQSGKGGIGYLMEQRFGINMPKRMREDFGYAVKAVSDHQHKELPPQELYDLFARRYLNLETPYRFRSFTSTSEGTYRTHVTLEHDGRTLTLSGDGNGRFDAVSNALREGLGIQFSDLQYTEHALESGSTSRAMAYVGITSPKGQVFWGAGLHNDIVTASLRALFSAVNRMLLSAEPGEEK